MVSPVAAAGLGGDNGPRVQLPPAVVWLLPAPQA